jgi:hypothetical protein
MAGEKIKLDAEAIRDILVAETNSESGAEASDVEDYFEEEEEEQEEKKMMMMKKRNNSSKPQQKSNHRLQQVADYQPGNCLK